MSQSGRRPETAASGAETSMPQATTRRAKRQLAHSAGSRIPPAAETHDVGQRPIGQVLLEVSTYDRREIATHPPMTMEEVLERFDFDAYDARLAKPVGRWDYRCPATGESVKYGENGYGIGRKALEFLTALQLNPGVYLDPVIIYQLTGREGLLDPGNFAAYVRRARLAHGEGKENGRFILTANGGVAWSADASWITVITYVPPERRRSNSQNNSPQE